MMKKVILILNNQKKNNQTIKMMMAMINRMLLKMKMRKVKNLEKNRMKTML